jgi:8-oxo-dGTP pyrophosphatase MutT (NUDIX family)
MEPGETPEQAILRELKEETGYVPGDLVELGSFGLSVDRNSHSIIGFVALDSKKVDTPKDEKFIQLVECNVGEFMTMAESGEPILLSDIGFFALARQKMGKRLRLD